MLRVRFSLRLAILVVAVLIPTVTLLVFQFPVASTMWILSPTFAVSAFGMLRVTAVDVVSTMYVLFDDAL